MMMSEFMVLSYRIPASTRGKSQRNQKDVEISQVRIHVERVIGLLKNKYTMLQGRLPISSYVKIKR